MSDDKNQISLTLMTSEEIKCLLTPKDVKELVEIKLKTLTDNVTSSRELVKVLSQMISKVAKEGFDTSDLVEKLTVKLKVLEAIVVKDEIVLQNFKEANNI